MEDLKAASRKLYDCLLKQPRVRIRAIEDVCDVIAAHQGCYLLHCISLLPSFYFFSLASHAWRPTESVPLGLIKVLLQLIVGTARVYRDQDSRMEIRNLLRTLVERFPDDTLTTFVPMFAELVDSLSKCASPTPPLLSCHSLLTLASLSHLRASHPYSVSIHFC